MSGSMPRYIELAAIFTAGACTGVLAYRSSPWTRPPVPTTRVEKQVTKSPDTAESGWPVQSKSAIVDPRGILKYGYIGPISDELSREAYCAGYDRRLRHPVWVAEHLTKESIGQKNARRCKEFYEDHAIPARFRALLANYSRSGYDRGHMTPAADAAFSETAMKESFYLTNIAPQVGEKFNRDYWSHFEHFCRSLTEEFKSVRVITGPLYLPKLDPRDGKYRVSYEVIGNPPNVSVPTHFFKLILGENPRDPRRDDGKVRVAAFVMPNAPIDNSVELSTFLAPIEAIERASGLELLSHLPIRQRVDLCQDVPCRLTIRQFNNRQKQLASPSKP